ncbi:MAG TPA: four helix bundle protein [Bacteroidota bacterium]|nr:four helix bundle protein [Bacteroidota bacterium]
MRNFRELLIWQKGMELVTTVYSFSNLLPKEEMFGLRSQIQRAAVSIPSNIAEGCSRTSESDFKRFLEIAIGSTYELETQLSIAQTVHHISKETTASIFQLLMEEQKMLNSFISSIKKKNNTNKKANA